VPFFYRSRDFHHPQCPNAKQLPRRFRALIISIEYTNVDHARRRIYPKLNCHDDAEDIKKLLIDTYGYKDNDIIMMMDKEGIKVTDKLYPTRNNILQAMENLVSDSEAGDFFVMYYAGHSGQIKAVNDNRETDGMDEYMVSADCQTIIDDVIREKLVKPLSAQTRLTAIFDACHSGTLLDLYNYPNPVNINHSYPGDKDKSALRRSSLPDDWKLHIHLNMWRFVVSFLRAYVWVRIRRWRAQRDTRQNDSSELAEAPRMPQETGEGMSVDGHASGAANVDDATLANVPVPPVIRCKACSHVANHPLVFSLSSCLDRQEALEDNRVGRALMTPELCKLLEKNPGMPVEDIRRNLQEMVFETTFRSIVKTNKWAKAKPEKRMNKVKKQLRLLSWQYLQIGSEHRRFMKAPFLVKAIP